MNLVSDVLVSLAASQLIQVTAVALVVGLVVRVACRRRPHLAYALWMLVIVKSLTPPLWSSPTGVFSWLGAETRVVHPNAPAGGFAGMPEERHAFPPAPGDTGVSPVLPDSRQGTGRMPVPPAPQLALVVWLAGVALLSGGLLVRWTRCARLLRRSAIPPDGSLKDHVYALAQRIGLRRSVRITVSREPVGPAVFGVLRPTVVLPARLLTEKPPRELEPILAHELVHVRRGDTLAGGLQVVAQILWWFHPLVWWSNRQARRERERCCDQEVIARLGCRPSEYVRCLLHVLEWRRASHPRFALSATGSWSVTSKRLEEIMRNARVHRRTPRWVWLALILAATLILPGAGLTLQRLSQASEGLPNSAKDRKTVPATRELALLKKWKEMDEAGARDVTVRHLHGLVRAVHKYYDTTNSFPPAVVSNAKLPPEKRLSGLVLLLPYLEAEWFGEEVAKAAQELMNGMDLDKGWDDPVNLKAARTVVPAFLAPRSGPFRDENGLAVSHFAFVRGAQGVDNGIFTDNGGIPVESITDGTVATFAVGQINKHLGPWTAAGPSTSRHTYDSQHSTDDTPTFGSNWPGGYYIAMADASVGFLDDQCPARFLYAHTTRAAGDLVLDIPRPRYWKYYPVKPRPEESTIREVKTKAIGVETALTIIAGQCIDSKGKPIVGCQVSLYRQSFENYSLDQLAQVSSKHLGRFEFEPVPTIGLEDRDVRYFIIAESRQHATATATVSSYTKESTGALRLILSQPGPVTGRVVTSEGKPIAGATVWVKGVIPKAATSEQPLWSQWFHTISPIANWLTISDNEGNFTIERLPADARVTVGVLQPDYVEALPSHRYRVRPPAKMRIEMLPGSTIEGRVVYGHTGMPAVDVMVQAQGKSGRSWHTTTDSKGEYRLVSLAADSYNIWAKQPDWTMRAHDSFDVGVGEIRKAPDLQLVSGGFVVGRVIDVDTEEPVKPGPNSDVGLYGPSRPRSGAAIESADVRPDGTFRIRVAPGENYVYLRTDEFTDNPSWARDDGSVTLFVQEGQTREVEFKAKRMTEEEIAAAKKQYRIRFVLD